MKPLIIDLETRSACDLRTEGGYRYAVHPTTRLLTVSWTIHGSEKYSVWLPGVEAIPEDMAALHLPGVRIHTGNLPAPLLEAADRTWIGHNAFGFDALVWQARVGWSPASWEDSACRGQAIGLPGALDAVGRLLWGEGKYGGLPTADKKRAFTATGLSDCEPTNVKLLLQVLMARYNIQDVRLTNDLWTVIEAEDRQTAAEAAVLAAHRVINDRGVRLDFNLWRALHALSIDSMSVAVGEIRRLTDGALPDEKALRSRDRMLSWLTRMGVWEGTSLRRELVSRFIDEHSEIDTDEDVEENKNLDLVVKVLGLRMSALRITGSKLAAAAQCMSNDRRIRGLFGYYKAHTGRFTSMRVQLHNLPRPKEGVDTWRLVDLFEKTGRLDYSDVRAILPAERSVDDAASGLLRSLFLPDGGWLAAADLCQIEARMLAYLAGEQWLLDAFWNDTDPYLEAAKRIMGPPETWPAADGPIKKHPYRQVFKVVSLGCGYQMGARKFALYAQINGLDLSQTGITPEQAITGYRRANPAIAGEEMRYKGHTYFRGGFWDRLNDAAIAACGGGGQQIVGRLSFHMEGGNLILTLPSGRRMVYRKASVIENERYGKMVPGVIYSHPRYGIRMRDGKPVPMYGGAWCWAAGTPILTPRGIIPISRIEPGDQVWDGENWAATDGAVYNGVRRTGRWLGVSVTAGHLIHDGRSWRDVIKMDALSSARCLLTGRCSIDLLSLSDEAVKALRATADAPAGGWARFLLEASCERKLLAVQGAPENINNRQRIKNGYGRYSQMLKSEMLGATDIQEWSPDALIRTIMPILTMGAEELRFGRNGLPTDSLSSDTSWRTYLTIKNRDLIWTDGTTTEIMSQETFGLSPENWAVKTGEPVYDLLNCGPRHAYTVITPFGPIIAHNCENAVQAASRDILAASIVEQEAAGRPVCLHVHDEEAASTEDFDGFMSAASRPPDWLPDFPLDAEGGLAPRYAKAAWPGFPEQVWRNGRRHK